MPSTCTAARSVWFGNRRLSLCFHSLIGLAATLLLCGIESLPVIAANADAQRVWFNGTGTGEIAFGTFAHVCGRVSATQAAIDVSCCAVLMLFAVDGRTEKSTTLTPASRPRRTAA